jgi:DNA-directed RNA polymerase subunit N (RpoN/RPB10)
MLYPICPTCGETLANIQIPYQKDMLALCDKYNIDIDSISRGTPDDDKIRDDKEKIINKYTRKRRYCCKMRLTNFPDLVNIVS